MHAHGVTPDRSFDVIVIGGGNAGIGTAARLCRRGIADVAVIEPQRVHTYRPLLSYVGSGQAALASAERTQRSVTPAGATWIDDTVDAIDADAHTVRCASGRLFTYRDLVVATGLVTDDAALPGVAEALATPAVGSNYVDAAEQTRDAVRAMRPGGHAVFTVPRPPVSCTGTTIKPLFLAAGMWRRAGILDDVDITLVVDREGLVGVPRLDARLERHLADLGVNVLRRTAVTALDPEHRSLTATGSDGATTTLGYDMLHLVPPFRGVPLVSKSGLAGDHATGVVDIDPTTFRHRSHPTVWGLGDGAAVDTDPSGGALRQQSKILVGNMIAARSGVPLSHYDGYTVAPIPTDLHRLIAAEFDRTGEITSSLPSFLDPLAPRRSAWAFDSYGLPLVYWYGILKGIL
ncbi:FAD-dependent oxidoreductase [Williamsia herbipolensis]|uniref:FAD-dependent oxidoreductase n=1 Tax=Williamsia herbipolensis TaxID=1603258 RepID=A0AAU4K4B2_9NOCA|nr:FAD-dependent oxidoreductase [Williamsia herbipolensis]